MGKSLSQYANEWFGIRKREWRGGKRKTGGKGKRGGKDQCTGEINEGRNKRGRARRGAIEEEGMNGWVHKKRGKRDGIWGGGRGKREEGRIG